MATQQRISTLDGLRLIAIMMVMFGHYYNFSKNDIIRVIAIYGYIGVPFFFIISGFVIYMSLEKCKNYTEFLKKRYLRLAPAMFICSTITFLFFKFINNSEYYYHSRQWINYLIANTFIDPNFFNIFYNRVKFYYIDNAYWSLWVEVNFYIIMGYLYFRSPKNVIRNYVILCTIGIPIFLLFSSEMGHKVLSPFFSHEFIKYMKLVSRAFAFFHECLWFLIGILLYKLFKNPKGKKYVYYIIIVFILLMIWSKDVVISLIYIGIFLVYMTFVYRPQYLSFLTNKVIARLGVVSYSIYLIHYHIGVATIKDVYSYFEREIILFPLVMIMASLLFGLLSYRYLETPFSKYLKKILFKKKT